jgi:hypothetical protein
MSYKYNKDKNLLEEQPTMEKPASHHYEDGAYDKEFQGSAKAYNEHLSSLKSYPLHGEVPDWWPEELEEGKHFKIDSKYIPGTFSGAQDDYELSAVPIPEVSEKKEESEDDLWKDVGVIIHGDQTFQFYPDILAHLKRTFTITRKK